jgi:hypothetical protein
MPADRPAGLRPALIAVSPVPLGGGKGMNARHRLAPVTLPWRNA